MENKKIKASSWVLGIILILSAAVLVMFYCVGFSDWDSTLNLTAPRYTGLLLVWQYVLVALTALFILGFGLVNGIKNMGYKGDKGAKSGFFGIVFLVTVVIIVVSFFMAGTKAVRLGDESLYSNVSMLKLTDVCLYSIYALAVLAIISALLSMTGIFKSKK
ncbi:MAG: hypothetical protein MJY66_08555 [Bacteroidaceae bacterium]|nr:hypothetical protein [Bacteroidaceae bacterium]